MSVEQFAEGVVRVVNANMERALRVVSVERGYDPREFTLVAFGGAGGLHACELAQALGIPRVMVPALPGALSAYGILTSDIIKDYSRTMVRNLDAKFSPASLSRQFEALERVARREFQDEGLRDNVKFERSVDLRYRGQGFELNVPFGKSLLADFHRQHKFRYGYDHPDRGVELVTLRLRARMPSPRISVRAKPAVKGRAAPAEKRRVWFSGKIVATAMSERQQLSVGKKVLGPSIVTEYSASTVVPPRSQVVLHRAGNLLIDLPKQRRPHGAPDPSEAKIYATSSLRSRSISLFSS